MTSQSKDGGCGLVIAAIILIWFVGECNARHRREAYDRGYQDRKFNDYNPSPPDYSYGDY